MKTKYFCRRCGEQLIGDGGYCHCCRENKGDADVEGRYFPDDPKNTVYAVDTYVTVCKCLKVEAANEEEAERKAQDYISNLVKHRTDSEYIRALADEGFQDAEGDEYKVSGEADEDGNVGYY